MPIMVKDIPDDVSDLDVIRLASKTAIWGNLAAYDLSDKDAEQLLTISYNKLGRGKILALKKAPPAKQASSAIKITVVYCVSILIRPLRRVLGCTITH